MKNTDCKMTTFEKGNFILSEQEILDERNEFSEVLESYPEYIFALLYFWNEVRKPFSRLEKRIKSLPRVSSIGGGGFDVEYDFLDEGSTCIYFMRDNHNCWIALNFCPNYEELNVGFHFQALYDPPNNYCCHWKHFPIDTEKNYFSLNKTTDINEVVVVAREVATHVEWLVNNIEVVWKREFKIRPSKKCRHGE